MDRFVCVRIVQGWGLDLSIFQFDWRQSWTVFLMNADRAVYGRYDARQADDLDRPSQGARRARWNCHEKWPPTRPSSREDRRPSPRWKSPERSPRSRRRGSRSPPPDATAASIVTTCSRASPRSVKTLREPVPERFLAPYPTPQRVGIMLSTKERATVDRTSTATAPRRKRYPRRRTGS
jgi:hypothetical protein